MSLASRLVVGLAGPKLDPAEAAWIEHHAPAGVILFARNCRNREQVVRLIQDLRRGLPSGAEICADHEGGGVSFLAAAADRPPALYTLGTLDDTDLTRRVHAETGRRLRSLGLDRVLAPCCDVLSAVHNPVIGSRAFGDDPTLVARHTAAAVEGLADAGLLGCAKHWPGHGGSTVDTHDRDAASAPAATHPFDVAMAAGLDAVMVGHLQASPEAPLVSLDPQGLAALRSRFPGAQVWCDDISMGALRPSLANRGITAGDGRSSGLVDPQLMAFDWLTAVADAGADRLLLRGIPWCALPGPDQLEGPPLSNGAAVGVRAEDHDSAVPDYREAFVRAAATVALRPGPQSVLWFDATVGDRLGESRGLSPLLERAWPGLVRLDERAPVLSPDARFEALIVTSHRPLTINQTTILEAACGVRGLAVVAGHPSLAVDLGRLLGHDWCIDALYGCSGGDLAALAELSPR